MVPNVLGHPVVNVHVCLHVSVVRRVAWYAAHPSSCCRYSSRHFRRTSKFAVTVRIQFNSIQFISRSPQLKHHKTHNNKKQMTRPEWHVQDTKPLIYSHINSHINSHNIHTYNYWMTKILKYFTAS